MKTPSRKTVQAFHELITRALSLPLPPADPDTGGREWEVQTPWGRLAVSAWGDDVEMIFLRFRDQDARSNPAWRARFPDANPFSGKWNILAPDAIGATSELRRKLELVMQPATV